VDSQRMHLGSCLCGAVRFEVEGDFQQFYLCHCGRCRNDSGSAHAANLTDGVGTGKLAVIGNCRRFSVIDAAGIPD
jgi:hypothetical protein